MLRMVSVEHDGTDGLIVTYANGTVAAYVAEELVKSRPFREVKESGGEFPVLDRNRWE